MHAGGWILYSTTQKTKHNRGFCMFELPQSPPNTLFFQPHNDLFRSSTASYLAFLSDLEGKIIIWCGGCSSALLILLCPWLLSLLYNSLKPFFLRMRFALDFCMWELSPKQPCAFVHPIIVQHNVEKRAELKNKTKKKNNSNVFKCFDREAKTGIYVPILPTASQYWIPTELADAFVCNTWFITAPSVVPSEDNTPLKKLSSRPPSTFLY